ncbi:MAG: signal peptidase II [Lentisphaeria bacterium]|nr:signal peptidase II [Lentisphaeria bacterium]
MEPEPADKTLRPEPELPGGNGGSRKKRGLAVCALTAAVLLLADQFSKILITTTYALHESTPVIPDIFSVTYVRNRGAAWGMFAGHGWFLLLVAVLAVAAIVRFYRYLTEGYAEREIALFMILSGVAGNSIDRLWRGEVVDFIDIHYKTVWHYPVFNIADIAICTGVGLFVLSGLLRSDKEKQK